MMKTLIHSLVLALLLASTATAKRMAPKQVPPISTPTALISAPHFPKGERVQKGGVLEAHDPKTKKLLWRIQVYRTTYNEELEEDVQDVFIRSLSIDKSHNVLILSDERGRVFVVDLETKKVTQIQNAATPGGPSREK